MERNVPADWDKYQKGVFDPDFLLIGAKNKRENFKNKKETFGLNCCNTKPMCFFMSMIGKNVLILKYI